MIASEHPSASAPRFSPPTADPTRRRKGTAYWNWAPLGILLVGSLFATASVALWPRDPRRVAAVFPPWWTGERSLAAASRVAAVTGIGAFPFIVAVTGGDLGLGRELRHAGAVLVVDGGRFAFCGQLTTRTAEEHE